MFNSHKSRGLTTSVPLHVPLEHVQEAIELMLKRIKDGAGEYTGFFRKRGCECAYGTFDFDFAYTKTHPMIFSEYSLAILCNFLIESNIKFKHDIRSHKDSGHLYFPVYKDELIDQLNAAIRRAYPTLSLDSTARAAAHDKAKMCAEPCRGYPILPPHYQQDLTYQLVPGHKAKVQES